MGNKGSASVKDDVPESAEKKGGFSFDKPWQDPAFDYPHSARTMPYRTEKFEPSASEQERISQLARAAADSSHDGSGKWAEILQPPLHGTRRKVLIDTDIGTDADDALALLAALHLPDDIDIVGITANYYPTRLRATVASRIVQAWTGPEGSAEGSTAPLIVAGPGSVCGSHRATFLAGNEGLGLGLSKDEVERLWEPVAPQSDEGQAAAAFVVETLRAQPGEVTIIAIGINTVVGQAAAHLGADFKALVRQVVIMAGGSYLTQASARKGVLNCEWPHDLPENEEEGRTWAARDHVVTLLPNHNSSGDTLGTMLLLQSGACVSLIPHSITAQFYLEGAAIETLLSAGASVSPACDVAPAETKVVGTLLFQWLKRRGRQRGQCPHDPLTVYEAVYPSPPGGKTEGFEERSSCLEYVHGTFVPHEWAAFLTFVPDPQGPHRLAVGVRGEPSEWLQWLERTLLVGVPPEAITEASSVETCPI